MKKTLCIFTFCTLLIISFIFILKNDYLININTDKSSQKLQHSYENETPLYDKIGVSKRCLYVWQVLTAEGYWPSDDEPGCKQVDIDKIDKYCHDDTDACYSYELDFDPSKE